MSNKKAVSFDDLKKYTRKLKKDYFLPLDFETHRREGYYADITVRRPDEGSFEVRFYDPNQIIEYVDWGDFTITTADSKTGPGAYHYSHTYEYYGAYAIRIYFMRSTVTLNESFFDNNQYIERIELGEAVTKVDAFSLTSSVRNIVFKAPTLTIANNAYTNCPNLQSITVNGLPYSFFTCSNCNNITYKDFIIKGDVTKESLSGLFIDGVNHFGLPSDEELTKKSRAYINGGRIDLTGDDNGDKIRLTSKGVSFEYPNAPSASYGRGYISYDNKNFVLPNVDGWTDAEKLATQEWVLENTLKAVDTNYNFEPLAKKYLQFDNGYAMFTGRSSNSWPPAPGALELAANRVVVASGTWSDAYSSSTTDYCALYSDGYVTLKQDNKQLVVYPDHINVNRDNLLKQLTIPHEDGTLATQEWVQNLIEESILGGEW